MPEINKLHVIVIVAFLVTLAAVVISGRSEAAFVVTGLAILGGIGVVAAQQASGNKETAIVREQTNGTQTAMVKMLADQASAQVASNERLIAILDAQGKLLARMQLPTDPPNDHLGGDDHE